MDTDLSGSSAPSLDWLAAQYVANRFIPMPPQDGQAAGDGDFKAIGAEFLSHFVRLGGLRPDHAVLDVGCGPGRMALPLTQYLDPARGRYHGFDVDAAAVAWCQRTVTSAYPNFVFTHLDIANDVYNPQGKIDARQLALPCTTGDVDFAILTSIFPHIRLNAIAHYIRELARVVRPGGRVFATLFLIGEIRRAALRRGGQRIVFDPDGTGPEYLADPQRPGIAVGVTQSWLLSVAAQAGLIPAIPIAYGHWCGGPGLSFQDIVVFERKGDQ